MIHNCTRQPDSFPILGLVVAPIIAQHYTIKVNTARNRTQQSVVKCIPLCAGGVLQWSDEVHLIGENACLRYHATIVDAIPSSKRKEKKDEMSVITKNEE